MTGVQTCALPILIASTLRGLQIVMSNGSLWKSVNNEALPRSSNGAVGTAATVLTAPRTIAATPGGDCQNRESNSPPV